MYAALNDGALVLLQWYINVKQGFENGRVPPMGNYFDKSLYRDLLQTLTNTSTMS